MHILDWIIVMVILMAAMVALTYVAHHKDDCSGSGGCSGDCSNCSSKHKDK